MDRSRGQTEPRKGKGKTKMRKSEAEREDAERDRGWPDGVKEPFAVIAAERWQRCHRTDHSCE